MVVSGETARLGEVIRCEWVVEAELSVEVVWPEGPPELRNLTVLAYVVQPPVVGGGMQTTRCLLVAEPIDAADVEIGGMKVLLRGAGGMEETRAASPRVLPFESWLTEGSALQPLQPDATAVSPLWFLPLVGIALFAAYALRRRRVPIAAAAPVPISATAAAIQIREGVPSLGEYETYRLVHECLAVYLRQRYQLTPHAPDRTAIANSLPASPDNTSLTALAQLLAQDDNTRYRTDAAAHYATTIATWLDAEPAESAI